MSQKSADISERFEPGPLSADEFTCDDARTGLRAHLNMAESAHSMFRRAIIGVWHQIGGKHMGGYLREVAFCWNNRGAFRGAGGEDVQRCGWSAAAQGAVFVRKKHGPIRADTFRALANAGREQAVLRFMADYRRLAPMRSEDRQRGALPGADRPPA